MITGPLKNEIDKLWTAFWTGGITNPLTVIEQITYLMFIKLLDLRETREERRAQRMGEAFEGRFFAMDKQHLRWSKLIHLPGDQMVEVFPRVFDHFKKLKDDEDAPYSEFMRDAAFLIQKSSLLVSAVNMIDKLPLEQADAKGDLYEYLLSKLTTAGIQGQFRTPRHIIRLMVDMLEPTPDMRIADPACGTGGFLVGALEHVMEKNTSPGGVLEDGGSKFYTGDLLRPDQWERIRGEMLHGFDFDATMLRIAAMNLMLHGVDSPSIHAQDTMSGGFFDKFEEARDGFDIVLANPPFKGTLDPEDISKTLLRHVKTKKTELLFIVLILEMLKSGGRSATIVPDGVLFGSSTAHRALRKLLVDENQLEAVISLPSGVFKPYAGVSTGILVFTKGGRTDHVFFCDVEHDGFSLDDKLQPDPRNDLPDCLAAWKRRNPNQYSDRTGKAFMVPVEAIRETQFDLSVRRYRENEDKPERFDPPKEILARLATTNKQIAQDIQELQEMLR